MGLDFAFLGVVVVGVARFRFLGFSAVADDDLVSSGGAAAAAAADVMVESGSSFDKVRKRSGFSIWTPCRHCWRESFYGVRTRTITKLCEQREDLLIVYIESIWRRSTFDDGDRRCAIL